MKFRRVREEEFTASARIDDSMATPTATFGEVPRQDYSHPPDTCVRGWKFIGKKSGAEYGQNRVGSLQARSIPMLDTCENAESDHLDDSYRP
ncbi:MAG: hypothetical protein WA813_23050 [Beijerinckiaceae bacterium]